MMSRISVYEGDVERHLPMLLPSYRNRHLFLFLDPCGAGLSFDKIVQLLSNRGALHGAKTELLLNFNGDLVRRVAAYWRGRTPGGAARSVLTKVCGGTWWVEAAERGRARDDSTWETALEEVVHEYVQRLMGALPRGHIVGSVPVRARVQNQPIFYLVFATSSQVGVWAFSNAVAFATREWRDECDKRHPVLQPSVVDLLKAEEDEERARQRLRANVLKLLERRPILDPIRDYSIWLLDGVAGELKESEIGRELRAMDAEGVIHLTKKKAYEQCVVSRPQ